MDLNNNKKITFYFIKYVSYLYKACCCTVIFFSPCSGASCCVDVDIFAAGKNVYALAERQEQGLTNIDSVHRSHKNSICQTFLYMGNRAYPRQNNDPSASAPLPSHNVQHIKYCTLCYITYIQDIICCSTSMEK
jgi:hypothetical protein